MNHQSSNHAALLQTIQENLPDGLVTFSQDGEILSFNKTMETLSGYRGDEVVGKNFKLLVPVTHRSNLDTNLQQLQRKDGGLIPVNIAITECTFQNKKLFIATITEPSLFSDIQSELASFKNTLDMIDEAVFMYDAKDMKFFYANQGAVSLLGYGQKELMQLHPWEIIPEHDKDSYCKLVEKHSQGEANVSSFETINRHKNGHTVPVEISLYYVQPKGDLPRYVAIIRDITVRRAIQDRLNELARFPEENVNAVLKIHVNGIITYANPASKPLRKSWNADVGECVPQYYKNIIKQCIKYKMANEFVVTAAKDKKYSVYMAPVAELDSVYVYARDITLQLVAERELKEYQEQLEEKIVLRTKQLEDARKQAEAASEAKSTFLANMSHEIRTPLSIIAGYAETMLDGKQSCEEKKNALETIITSSNHLQKIINNILDLSKIEAQQLELEKIPVSLYKTTSEVCDLARGEVQGKGLEFKSNIEENLPDTIFTDPVRLKQILINLCHNAIKFTHQGYISLDVRIDEKNKNCKFSIRDTGIGMSEEQMQRLFRRFSQADSSTTRQFGGTGIGLALSRQLAEGLGGDISVTSRPGEGSTFILTLPIDDQNPTATRTDTQTTTKVNADVPELHGKVLIVEDSEPLQKLVRLHLERAGLDVVVAQNGQEALDKTTDELFDLIFMDIQMPVMDGLEATQRLRNLGYEKPIVAMTANAFVEDKNRCLEAGCADFISKPVQKQRLYEITARFLNWV